MSDNWQDDPRLQRAAWEGLASNPVWPLADRFQLAQQTIDSLHKSAEDLLAVLVELQAQHKAAGLYPAALAYGGAIELVREHLTGHDEEGPADV